VFRQAIQENEKQKEETKSRFSTADMTVAIHQI
jgi:hypothetical protein